MLLANCVHASSLEALDVVTVRCLQRSEYLDVTRPKPMVCVKRKAAHDDLVKLGKQYCKNLSNS